MALPSSAMRPASSSSETTSAPRSGSSSNGGGMRRGVPFIAGTLPRPGPLSVVGPGARLDAEASGSPTDLSPPAHLGAPHLTASHGQHPLDGGGVGRVGTGDLGQP